ncbi:MAG: hypothetical protein CSA58_00445, partial [Micrococcales bacterium]
FLPSVPTLLQLAGQLEAERDHALDRPRRDDDELEWAEDADLARANAEEAASDSLSGSFEALEAEAEFSHVLFDGGEFGVGATTGSAQEQDYLGIPGLLEPDQVRTLLRQRQRSHSRAGSSRRGRGGGPAPGSADGQQNPTDTTTQARHRDVAALRKELNSLVATWARKTGQPHGQIHTELRQACGGGQVATATPGQIQARIDVLRARFVRRV